MVPTTRFRNEPKNVWSGWCKNFDRDGWENKPLGIKFEKRFALKPLVVKMVIKYESLINAIPKKLALSKEDSILLVLYRLKSGCAFYVLMDIFGSSESTLSRVFNEVLNIMVTILAPVIQLPSAQEFKKEQKILKEMGYPDYDQTLIADCFDTGIESKDPCYYTYKKACSSQHAIRTMVFVSRLTSKILAVEYEIF